MPYFYLFIHVLFLYNVILWLLNLAHPECITTVDKGKQIYLHNLFSSSKFLPLSEVILKGKEIFAMLGMTGLLFKMISKIMHFAAYITCSNYSYNHVKEAIGQTVYTLIKMLLKELSVISLCFNQLLMGNVMNTVIQNLVCDDYKCICSGFLLYLVSLHLFKVEEHILTFHK